MKVTSEQLLDLFGLKIGDIFWLRSESYRYRIDKDSSTSIVVYDFGLGRYFKFNQFIFEYNLIGSEYEIIKPKPTLTEDEKVILRNLPKECKWIVREKDDRLWVHKEIPTRSLEPCGWEKRSVNSLAVNLVAFNHLFQFITWEDEPYLIEDLLK